MNAIERTVIRVRRRLRLVRGVGLCARFLPYGLGVATALLAADKLGVLILSDWRSAVLPPEHRLIVMGTVGIALLAAGILTLCAHIGIREAALRLDAAMGLQERSAASLFIMSTDHPWRDAICSDASRRLEGADVSRLFPLPSAGVFRAGMGMAVLYLAVALGAGEADVLGARQDAREAERRDAQNRNEVASIKKDLQARRLVIEKIAARSDADDALRKLVADMRNLEDRLNVPGLDPKQAIELKQRLEERIREEQARLAEAEPSMRLDTAKTGSELPGTRQKQFKTMRRMGAAAESLAKARRRMMRRDGKEPANAANPAEAQEPGLSQLSEELRQLGEEMSSDNELKALGNEMQAMSEELKGMEGMNPELTAKMRELMKNALRGSEQQPIDMASLTAEERELLQRLQAAVGRMELDENMLRSMLDAMESGRVAKIDQDALRAMLEKMKNGGSCGDTGNTGVSSGPSAVALVPMPGMGAGAGAGSGASAGGQGSASGAAGTGGQGAGTAHVPGGGTPPSEAGKDAAFEDLRVRSAVGEGPVVASFFVRGVPTDRTVKAEYREVLRDATLRSAEAADEQLIPDARRNLIRDYMTRLNSMATTPAQP